MEAGEAGPSAESPPRQQRAVLGFTALFKRLQRKASSHERVPSSEDEEAAPTVRVIAEPGPEAGSSGRQEGVAGGAGSPRLGRAGSCGKDRVCLICLDGLTEEEFRSGAAISLECGCRGDLALRHKACAVKWVQVKGDNICELCKQPVRNLPAPPPRPAAAEEARAPGIPDSEVYYDPQLMEFAPTSADVVFDCVRVRRARGGGMRQRCAWPPRARRSSVLSGWVPAGTAGRGVGLPAAGSAGWLCQDGWLTDRPTALSSPIPPCPPWLLLHCDLGAAG